MPLQRAKSPQHLYDTVADHDLVLTPDAPLASAINRRIDRPHFGTFATTPRRLAAGRREQAEDRTAFLEVIDQTDHDWEAVAYAIGNVLQCWEHQGTVDAVLKYDAYADATTEAVVDIMADLRTTSGQLTAHTVAPDQDVAVIGADQLTTLERQVVPEDATHVDLFTDEAFEHPPFHIFESPTAIVDALVTTLTADQADNVAVVLDAASQYSSLVESALDATGIPFYGGPGFIDDPHHRAFVQLLRLAFRGSTTTVGDAAPVLTQLNIDVPTAHLDKRLDAVAIPATDWLQSITATIETHIFSEVLDAYADQADTALEQFAAELETLGLADAPVTPDRVDDLAYYLQTYEVPVDRDNEGVLLADAKAAGYVDRPVVFHLGLDEGWTHNAPQRPWVDTEAQFDRYIGQFQLLLQSGADQYYLVQDSAGGQPVTPCLYFDELLEQSYERFSDLPSTAYTHTPTNSHTGFDTDPVDADPTTLDTISQSSLNTYVNSPRDYLFSRVLETPDQERFVEGNLFHDFAEFYVCHPETVANADLEALVDAMLAQASPFFADADRPLRRRTYRIGLETIMSYLDENAPEEDFLTPASGFGTNTFAEYFDQPIDSPLTERWFGDAALGVKGKVDLVQAPDHLLDYKSGSKSRATKVVKEAGIDPIADTPNFQALLYLTYYRTVQPDEPLSFTFFHFLETLEDVITGGGTLEDCLTTIEYYPFTFDEYVGSRAAYDVLMDGYNDCQATFEDLGFPAYTEIMADLSFPATTDKEELRASTFAADFEAAVLAGTDSSVDAEKGADQAIRELNGVRKRAFFREDVDAFEDFLDTRLNELNRRRTGDERFPIDGPGGEPNYRRVDHRDLLLEGASDE